MDNEKRRCDQCQPCQQSLVLLRSCHKENVSSATVPKVNASAIVIGVICVSTPL